MLEKSSYVERVLIVLNSNGTIKGAHSQTLDTISEDGIELRVSQGDPQPVSADAIGVVLPTLAQAISQIQSLIDVNSSLETKIKEMAAEMDRLRGVAMKVGDANEALILNNTVLEKRLMAASEEIIRLRDSALVGDAQV